MEWDRDKHVMSARLDSDFERQWRFIVERHNWIGNVLQLWRKVGVEQKWQAGVMVKDVEGMEATVVQGDVFSAGRKSPKIVYADVEDLILDGWRVG